MISGFIRIDFTHAAQAWSTWQDHCEPPSRIFNFSTFSVYTDTNVEVGDVVGNGKFIEDEPCPIVIEAAKQSVYALQRVERFSGLYFFLDNLHVRVLSDPLYEPLCNDNLR